MKFRYSLLNKLYAARKHIGEMTLVEECWRTGCGGRRLHVKMFAVCFAVALITWCLIIFTTDRQVGHRFINTLALIAVITPVSVYFLLCRYKKNSTREFCLQILIEYSDVLRRWVIKSGLQHLTITWLNKSNVYVWRLLNRSWPKLA